MVNVPPAAKVPPICKEPLVRAPVVKSTEPSVPVTRPPPFRPFTAMRVEPDKLNPLFVPTKVPPLFVKSTPLEAKAIMGRANASRANKSTLFIQILLSHLNQGSRPYTNRGRLMLCLRRLWITCTLNSKVRDSGVVDYIVLLPQKEAISRIVCASFCTDLSPTCAFPGRANFATEPRIGVGLRM